MHEGRKPTIHGVVAPRCRIGDFTDRLRSRGDLTSHLGENVMLGAVFVMPLCLPRRRKVSLLAVLLVTAVASASSLVGVRPAAATVPLPAAGCTISAKLVNSCRPWLGAESGGYGVTTFRASMLEHETRIGRQLDIVHEYLAPGDVLTSDVVAMAKRPAPIPLVNWRPADRWADADGRSATVNAQIDAMAASVKALGSAKI